MSHEPCMHEITPTRTKCHGDNTRDTLRAHTSAQQQCRSHRQPARSKLHERIKLMDRHAGNARAHLVCSETPAQCACSLLHLPRILGSRDGQGAFANGPVYGNLEQEAAHVMITSCLHSYKLCRQEESERIQVCLALYLAAQEISRPMVSTDAPKQR